MKLTELEPKLYVVKSRREIGKFLKPGIDPLRGNWTDDDFDEREHDQIYYEPVATLAEADCISFLHPAQFKKHGGKVGTMQIMVWFEGKALWGDLNMVGGQYVRWHVEGTGYDDLTTTPSILIDGEHPERETYWHGYITKGEITGV